MMMVDVISRHAPEIFFVLRVGFAFDSTRCKWDVFARFELACGGEFEERHVLIV